MKRLGIAVARTVLRAVVADRGQVVWAAERVLDGTTGLADALAELAAQRPAGVRRARVALEADVCQVKFLRGLPRLSRARLERAVALQAGRWFLRNGTPLVTGATRIARGGSALGAAADRSVVEAVLDGIAAAGLRLGGISPAAPLIAGLLPDGCHTRVGSPQEELTVRAGRLEDLRRRRDGGPAEVFVLAVPGLEGREAAFAAAYAAARGVPALELGVAADGAGVQQRSRARLLRVGAVALLLWGAAAGVFIARMERAERAVKTRLTRLAPALDAALAAQRDLGLAESALSIMAVAQQTRSQDAALLGALTAALPDSAYLVALTRSRDDRVTIAGYAPSAARVLAALGARPGVHEASLQGPVTREAASGTTRERFAIGFRWYAAELKP